MKIIFDSIFAFNYHKDLKFYNFTHNTHELIYFLTGDGITKINGATYTYKPHTICFTLSGDVRDSICTKKTDYICIRFLSDDLFFELQSGIYSCPTTELLDLFSKIQKEVLAKDYNYYDICNLNIAEILFKLSRVKVLNIKDKAFYNLIREIDTTLYFKKSIEEMAVSVSYSYDHFRHKFKELTGQPPTKYIINKRIENACHFLNQNEHTCTDISQMCGFSSSAQFSKIFKKVIGISPVDYKNSHQSI